MIPIDDVFSKANGCCACNGQTAVTGTDNERKAIRKEKTDIWSEMLQFENLHRRKNGDYRLEASPFYLYRLRIGAAWFSDTFLVTFLLYLEADCFAMQKMDAG